MLDLFFTEDAMPRAPKKTSKPNGNGTHGHVSSEEVARRAYDLYLSRGGGHGLDFDDWIEAERQLKQDTTPQQPPPPAAPERRKRTRATS
jgi:hypothetical protein